MIENLIRPSLRGFEAYSSARSLGIGADIYLDANELGLGSAVSFSKELNRYPDPECSELRRDLSRWSGVAEKNLFLCAGSDQGIDLLIRLFCEPFTDEIAVIEPTYGMYKTCAELQGVGVRRLSLNENFDLTAAEILPRLGGAKLLFLCSPNNPTGNLLSPAEVVTLLKGNRDGLVVIDQAYLEFCGDRASADWSRAISDFENLVILRTFSKAWGLAAIRLGYVIANERVVAGLKRVMPPYPISAVTAVIAGRALASPGFLHASVDTVRRERSRIAEELSRLSIVREVLPSETNFLLVRFTDRDGVFEKLLERGLCVRRRSEPELLDSLRITIGSPAENSLLLERLKELS